MQQAEDRSYDFKLSKSLSWLLRHGAQSQGLSFQEGGFINVNEILRLDRFHNYNQDDILRAVEQNDKKRFSIRFSNDSLQIRANQGHSLPVDEKELLTLLTESTAPSIVYHGTYFSKLPIIQEIGLSRMKRNHIHFCAKFPDQSVVSGIRKNCEVVIAVDAVKAMTDGYTFYKSDNEVILSPGNESGIIPPLYFKHIYQIHPLKQLWPFENED